MHAILWRTAESPPSAAEMWCAWPTVSVSRPTDNQWKGLSADKHWGGIKDWSKKGRVNQNKEEGEAANRGGGKEEGVKAQRQGQGKALRARYRSGKSRRRMAYRGR